MAEAVYKNNEVIEVVYQAPNKESGLTGVTAVEAEIFLPSNAKDSNFLDVALVELGSTGIYTGTFTPDEVGEWKVLIHKSDGDGQVVKRYSVGDYNVSAVGENVAALDTKVDTNASATDANVDAKTAVTDGLVGDVDAKLDTNSGVTDGLVGDVQTKADTIENKVDAIDIKVSSLDTPPMVS